MKHDSSKCIVLWVVTQEGGRLNVDDGTEDKPHNHRTRQESADLISVSILLMVGKNSMTEKKANYDQLRANSY